MIKKLRKSLLVVAYTKLFIADVAELRRRAKSTGIPWQTALRAIVHDALTGPKLHAFKYLIPSGRPRHITDQVTVAGCLAVATAHSQEEALALLHRLAAEEGMDSRWLGVADTVEIPLDKACRLAWSQN